MRRGEYAVMFQVEDDYWWYRGLRQLLRWSLARYAPRRSEPVRILDAGCGTGANLKLFQSYGRAIGIDISEEAVSFCQRRGIPADRAFIASLTELPFVNSSFDLVISLDVICNIPDDAAAFKEIGRVLRPGGRLITQLPAYQWLWSTHDVAVGHQRRYSTARMRAEITRAGFVVERTTHTNALVFPLIAAGRLVRRRGLHNGKPIQSDLATSLPAWINNSLGAVTAAEMRAVEHMDFPIGVSILVVARKV